MATKLTMLSVTHESVTELVRTNIARFVTVPSDKKINI